MMRIIRAVTARTALLSLVLATPACLSPMQETAAQALIATNAAKITKYCAANILPITSNPLTAAGVAVLSDLSPIAASAAGALAQTCDPANIAAVSQSASTLAYLAANRVNVTSNGKTVAPVIAPVPIVTGDEVLTATPAAST